MYRYVPSNRTLIISRRLTCKKKYFTCNIIWSQYVYNICVFKLYIYIYNTWKYIHISKEMWNELEVRKRLRIWPTHQHKGTVLVTANAVPLVGVRVNIQADEQRGRCRMLQVASRYDFLLWFLATLKTTKLFMTITILAGFLHFYLFVASHLLNSDLQGAEPSQLVDLLGIQGQTEEPGQRGAISRGNGPNVLNGLNGPGGKSSTNR